MSAVFIIGNGFDLLHGIKSSYYNFKDYVQNNNKDLFDKLNELYVPENLWSDFEAALAKPNSKILSTLKYGFSLDISFEIFKEIRDSFNKRIRILNGTDCCKNQNILKLFKENDNFITFNYTSILEKIYKIKMSNIYHIHGWIVSECFGKDEIIFGHGQEPKDNDFDLIKKTYKNVISNINKKQKILDNILNNSKEIYVLGFSYNDIDFPYFEYIKNKMSEIKWNFYYYSSKDLESLHGYVSRLNLSKESYRIAKSYF